MPKRKLPKPDPPPPGPSLAEQVRAMKPGSYRHFPVPPNTMRAIVSREKNHPSIKGAKFKTRQKDGGTEVWRLAQ